MMRAVLDDVGRIELPDAEVTLQMSQGVHSGEFHFFAVGASHTELLPTGPGWSRLVAMEHDAPAPARSCSRPRRPRCSRPNACGEPKGPGQFLAALRRASRTYAAAHAAPATCPPTGSRTACRLRCARYVLAGGGASEHRPVTVAFLRYEGIDALIAEKGIDAATDALHQLVRVGRKRRPKRRTSRCSPPTSTRNGGKLILTAGAPKVTGDDEERMLLAVRRILDADLPLPVRIGINRGAVFAGDIGPAYRRTLHGDGRRGEPRGARDGQGGARPRLRDRESCSSARTRCSRRSSIEPFAVKGKAEPVHGVVGRARERLAHAAGDAAEALPLTGRNNELGVIRKIARRHALGRGPSDRDRRRQPASARPACSRRCAMPPSASSKMHDTCEAYTSSTPYAVWRDLLREMMEIPRDATDADVETRLRAAIGEKAPDVEPWLPLIAAAYGIRVDSTPEVDMLAEENRRAKLHEAVERFLGAMMPGPAFVEIENAHHMDEASADLLKFLVGTLPTHRWLLGDRPPSRPRGIRRAGIARASRASS